MSRGLVWDHELAAFDVETTGLDARRGDRVVEIAVVRGRWGETPRRWSTLVQPDRPVGATHVHGITDEMVATSPRWRDVAPELVRQFGDALPIAHNASFDLGFLRVESQLAGVPSPVGLTLDTLGLARRFFGLPSNALASLCAHFGIDRERAHRADDDALATWHLAWRMLAAVDPEHTWTVETALRLARRRTTDELRGLRDQLHRALVASAPVEVEYNSPDRPGAERTRRTITVRQVRADRVVAWCHLREAERTFRLDRLQLVAEP